MLSESKLLSSSWYQKYFLSVVAPLTKTRRVFYLLAPVPKVWLMTLTFWEIWSSVLEWRLQKWLVTENLIESHIILNLMTLFDGIETPFCRSFADLFTLVSSFSPCVETHPHHKPPLTKHHHKREIINLAYTIPFILCVVDGFVEFFVSYSPFSSKFWSVGVLSRSIMISTKHLKHML